MIDFIEYVVAEIKSKRLSKSNALALIKQFSRQAPAAADGCILHPLVHCNTSDLTQQSYRSTFTGDEFFLRDHRIQGRKVLPAVAYLEMARAALSQALPGAGSTPDLRNAVWAQPVVVDTRVEVHTALFVSEEGGGTRDGVDVEIHSADDVVHFQARAVLGSTQAPAKVDINALRARMKGQLAGSELYSLIGQAGIDLGAAQRGVTVIHRGEQELLADIRRPDDTDEGHEQYVLHPSVMDSAVQAGMSLFIGATARATPLPFALESLRVFSGTRKEMLAWVRYASGSTLDDKVVKLDIDLCDLEGNVCIQLRGFSSRMLSVESSKSSAPADTTDCLLAVPAWQPLTAGVLAANQASDTTHVVLCDLPGIDAQQMAGKCLKLTTTRTSVVERYNEVALTCFEHVRAILRDKPQGQVLLQLVAAGDADNRLLAGLSGMLRTAALENPKFFGQVVIVPPDVTTNRLIEQLREAASTREPIVRYEQGGGEVLRWRECDEALDVPRLAFKDCGVYLITGGLGGVGMLFAKEILAKTASARILLTGRSALTPEKQIQLQDLGAQGRVFYRQLDVCNVDEVTQVVATAIREHGQLSGIIHSAGTTADNFILKKNADELREVLAPKVRGVFNVDQASRDVDLDFLALFSSSAGVFGNAGQADYAAANGFMDAFAEHRNRRVAANECRGLTLSLNWPLWQDGGMRVDHATQEMLRHTAGMRPMSTTTGMRAFHRSLELRQSQVLVMEGDLPLMRRAVFGEPEAHSSSSAAPPAQDAGDLMQRTEDYLRQQFSSVLKLAAHRIDPQAPLERYGIDSILAMELTGQLERGFGSLPKTLFFEYQTIRELTAYFVKEHSGKLAGLVTGAPVAPAVKPAAAAVDERRAIRTKARASKRFARSRNDSAASSSEPIAIVGLAGRYPEAIDVDAYWRNLRDGRDCIVEVPKERWDWREYFSEDRTAAGRHYSKWGGFIPGVDEFDPLFFNIPPVDAELIDPQERLFLQHAWQAIEDAGYTRASLQTPHADGLPGQVGVYVGVMYGEYQLFGAEASLQGKRMGVPVSYASIANRVSYVLNLHGPSMTLDSMCSSSLTAIHLACQDLKQGRTQLAIAGGVNVTVHPNKYLILSAGQFISSDGHCQSFGEGGDGYIPGEGVGVVVLKRLSDAQRDGNHIYGVIKGSALNHGGKTNGYSVPNPQAQADVIAQALKECGADARHISYIEAHGTGTKLGDPIEIAALTQVFRRHTPDKQFCAIGSAKSNIGHCESAAGIAGLTKVLLQMKHQLIVPSLHSAKLNPHIDFDASPFVVNQTVRPWEQPETGGRRLPRLAGISSFGAGGSNAHLIVEEYTPQPRTLAPSIGPVIVPISARTPDQLQQRVRELAGFIRNRELPIDLAALAYTLQVGREPMAHRLALLVDSTEQLAARLEACERGDLNIEQCFQGHAEQGAEGMSVLSQDEDMVEAIDRWIARRKLSKLADLWVKGLEVDWRKLHGEHRPGLVSLPAYPFAKDRYWVARHVQRNVPANVGASTLHPLIHANTSDFFQQSYVSTFSGNESFLTDHQVRVGAKTQKVLPAVVYLEMARAAAELALPERAPRELELTNVAWAQPLIADGDAKVSVALSANATQAIDFEVRSSLQPAGEETIHCQGRVLVKERSASEALDLQALKRRMSRGSLGSEQVYDAFQRMGIVYGPAFRGVIAIQRGDRELIAELALPNSAEQTDGVYTLHPSLLDSALQAAIGLIADLDDLPRTPTIPFALDSLRVVARCESRMVAWVRYTERDRSTTGLVKVDIDLCNTHGGLCVRMSGLTSRALATADTQIGSLLAQPAWEIAAARSHNPGYARHEIVLCNVAQLSAMQLATALPGVATDSLTIAEDASVPERYRAASLACFEKLQAILKTARDGKHLFQVVIGEQGDGALLAGLSGLIRTARLENPNLVGQVILINDVVSAETLAEQLRAAGGLPEEALLKLDGAALRRWRWVSHPVPATATASFKNDGIYLITGGLGGLGLLFAREIFRAAPGASVILTGRTLLDENKQAALHGLIHELGISNRQLVYRKLDLTDLAEVEALIAKVREEFGRLDGILHSAGMIRDGFMVHKTAMDFADVLAPKVDGLWHLDLATKDFELDFLVMFSSVAAATGNVGQADYAAANAFMDQYAHYRNRLVSEGARHGQTLSINWPLWEEGGMQLDAEAREMLYRVSGMVPLQTATGMRAFHGSLGLRIGQTLVVEGHVEQLQSALDNQHGPEPEAAPSLVDSSTLLERTRTYLSEEFAELIRIPPNEVDPKAPLEKYGIDSVLAMKFTNQLERAFGSLSKTLLFQYQTLGALAGYLAKTFPATLEKLTGVANNAAPPKTVTTEVPPNRAPIPMARAKTRFIEPAAQDDDVAIIGVAGKYPLARDLRDFWDNLKNGRDCITEVPRERWDHSRYFHPERNQPGKTYGKWGGFLDGVDRFDALFFNISPKEAELIDPQERLFLETVWETIEDAGYSKEGLADRRVGVYVGVMWGQYELYAASDAGVPSSSFASIANRVSYFFDFHGPSLALDTMCSSSLTAVHLASEEVRKGTVDVAVAGGVNVSIHPNKYLSLSQGNFASTDGRCRSFGQGGDGYVPGEGVGAVLLKSVSKALADGDHIYAVIKGSSINHGGKTNGYTVPNPVAQSALISQTLAKAKIDPATIDFIEAHGTGTSLGDPIEITGLTQAFEDGSTRRRRCPIGSVKSNIGHLESAAGIAAITKVLLQLEHGQLVPSLHAQPANPNLDFDSSPFYVQTSLQDWDRVDGRPRRAGVSSFGAGGANAHVILEEFIDGRSPATAVQRPEALVLSARNKQALVEYARKFAAFLDEATNATLSDIAFTAQVGRTPLPERLVVIASSKASMRQRLMQWLDGPRTAVTDVHEGNIKHASSDAALIVGEAGEAFVRLMLERRDLAKLAKLWISGAEIDWARLYAGERVRRVSLPTYPFQRERFWIETASSPAVAPVETVPQNQPVYYRSTWLDSAPTDSAARQTAPLLVLDAGEELCAELRSQNSERTVVLVQPGAEYRRLRDNVFRLNVAAEQDFARLVEDLQARDLMPADVVHCWPADDSVQPQLERGLFSVHNLCKSLLKQKSRDRIRIVFLQVDERAQAPLHSALSGYFRTLALENPKFSGKTVAIHDSVAVDQVTRRVLDELADRGHDREVRYRSGRQVRVLERYRPSLREPSVVKQHGVYLITGGLGGLGYIFAEHLVRVYHARIALLGRSTLNEEQQRRLDDLRAYGDNVLYLRADVTDRDQLAAAVREIKQRYGRLDGVIHSAGVHRDSFVLNKTVDEMNAVLSAKVLGTINLDLATSGEALDLFVLFSSVAGVLGNAGQSDYAYANSFLDAFADQRQALVSSGERSGKTLSIDWPFWQEGGMQLSASDVELTERRAGIRPLPTLEGVECWETLLRADTTQAAVLYGAPSTIDANVLRKPAQASASAPTMAEVAKSTELNDTALLSHTQEYLIGLLSEQIKLPADRIDPQERFEAFGVDSMMVARINGRLEKDLGELPKTLFYEYATIEELAAYLAQEARERLAKIFAMTAVAPVATHLTQVTAPSDDVTAHEEEAVDSSAERIAIIGIHGSFPRSETLEEFWAHLRQGRDLIEDVPASRWNWQQFFDADPERAKDGKIYCKSGGFLRDIDKFDAAFFGIPAGDARLIDPQERLFLQSVWAAIEDAGYTRETLKKRHPKAKSADVGVFGGVTTNSYHLLAADEWNRGNMVTPGAMPWSIVNRVSYVFDFQGPSMPVDTACSSSLVAIHLACQSLNRNECQVAVAGGVNLYLHPSKYHSLCRKRMLAADGKCRSFGAGDDGFVPGEGVGAVVLKPLSRAVADGDHIYGVIAASGYEHSGRSNGYSAPNPASQASLIEQTLHQADIHPDTIGYVEGHGTGTQLGDSLEIASLTQAFRRRTERTQFCPLGSVKANVGHSESAAGITGVAKILLQFKHGKIAPTIHSRTANPNIDFASSPFYLQHELSDWKSVGQPRRALINSFGAGGVNACLVLEEYQQPVTTVPVLNKPKLIVLSAKNARRLRERAEQLRDHLVAQSNVDLARLAYTLQVGRESMEERLCVIASDTDQLLDQLHLFLGNIESANVFRGSIEARRRKSALKAEEKAAMRSAYQRGELAELAQRWVAGQDFDWDDLHEGARPTKLPLPSYPFEKERHWVSDAMVAAPSAACKAPATQLHPLVSSNVSTLRETCFLSSLSDHEYYARDHKVSGEMFFPGAGFLEIACVSGAIAGEQAVASIRDIVWMQPLRFTNDSEPLKTFLKANGNGTEYVIVSFNDENERVVHSEGRLLHEPDRKAAPQAISIAALKQRCGKSLQGALCYREFEKFGFRYGPTFQTIQELFVGGDFALSKLRLAPELSWDFEQYLLHPCLIDGALQTVIGIAGEAGSDTPYLPFAVDAVEILRPLAEVCYAYVELAPSEHSSRADIKRFNIQLLSESGEVLVMLNNFYVRALAAQRAGQHGHASGALISE